MACSFVSWCSFGQRQFWSNPEINLFLGQREYGWFGHILSMGQNGGWLVVYCPSDKKHISIFCPFMHIWLFNWLIKWHFSLDNFLTASWRAYAHTHSEMMLLHFYPWLDSNFDFTPIFQFCDFYLYDFKTILTEPDFGFSKNKTNFVGWWKDYTTLFVLTLSSSWLNLKMDALKISLFTGRPIATASTLRHRWSSPPSRRKSPLPVESVSPQSLPSSYTLHPYLDLAAWDHQGWSLWCLDATSPSSMWSSDPTQLHHAGWPTSSPIVPAPLRWLSAQPSLIGIKLEVCHVGCVNHNLLQRVCAPLTRHIR
jgi:hypothetical protein